MIDEKPRLPFETGTLKKDLFPPFIKTLSTGKNIHVTGIYNGIPVKISSWRFYDHFEELDVTIIGAWNSEKRTPLGISYFSNSPHNPNIFFMGSRANLHKKNIELAHSPPHPALPNNINDDFLVFDNFDLSHDNSAISVTEKKIGLGKLMMASTLAVIKNLGGTLININDDKKFDPEQNSSWYSQFAQTDRQGFNTTLNLARGIKPLTLEVLSKFEAQS